MAILKDQEIKIYWPIGLSRDMPDRTNRADLIEEAINGYTQLIMAPGTTVTVGWMEKTTSLLSSIFLGMINDVYMVNDILKAERQGYDAAMVGPHWDPGLMAAREAASIPVTGPGESAMLLAHTLGRRFAILDVHEGYVPMVERIIRLYGFEEWAIALRPVRRFGMTYDNFVRCIDGTSDEFLVEFEKTARECIADGADIILAGGQIFGPVFLKHNFFTIPNTGVPVIDVGACGLKLAEMLVSLRRSIRLKKSEHVNAPFRTPPRDILDRVRSTFGLNG
jgi:allantoin racemase